MHFLNENHDSCLYMNLHICCVSNNINWTFSDFELLMTNAVSKPLEIQEIIHDAPKMREAFRRLQIMLKMKAKTSSGLDVYNCWNPVFLMLGSYFQSRKVFKGFLIISEFSGKLGSLVTLDSQMVKSVTDLLRPSHELSTIVVGYDYCTIGMPTLIFENLHIHHYDTIKDSFVNGRTTSIEKQVYKAILGKINKYKEQSNSLLSKLMVFIVVATLNVEHSVRDLTALVWNCLYIDYG